MREIPTLQVREWSRTAPGLSGQEVLLRGLTLTEADRELLDELARRTSLRVEELRQGLLIEVGPHIGTVTLNGLRIVIMPKLRLDSLMRMVAYAFDLSDLALTHTRSDYTPASHGLLDLLGLSLLRTVERIARGGLLPRYRQMEEELGSPRGRISMHHLATRPGKACLRCTFDDLTADHLLNQVLAAGLRLGAKVMENAGLCLDLARAADRLLAGVTRLPLNAESLNAARRSVDRRSSHYQTALALVALIFQGSYLGEHVRAGEMPLSGFLLNMNQVFERFLARHLQEQAPAGMRIISQDVRTDVFAYLENPSDWKHPTIRPDLVFQQGDKTIALGDAKYRNRLERPPGTAELYQLTTYGLSYPMAEPREVILFYPLGSDQMERPAQLLFAPDAARERIRIRLVGVPIEEIVSGRCPDWWPVKSILSNQNLAEVEHQTGQDITV